MKSLFFIIVWSQLATAAMAQSVVPVRTLRANTIIDADDLGVKTASVPGSFENPENVIGQEARIALYAGRPIRFNEIGPPAIVNRNQIVDLVFMLNGLKISTEGRALGRGGVGDRIRVMNLTSRAALFGTVSADGSVRVTD